jgi:chromosome partitioning protein
MPAVSLVLLNQKGGVGKTSTCHHLAGTLAKAGRRVLLIDNDPQASLTQGLFGPQATRAFELETTVAAIYRGEAIPEQIIHATEIPGIELIPGSRHAMKYNNAEPWKAERDLQVGLREVVDAVRDRYDMILIDCPPNLHLCSWAALVACDHLIVPLQPEDYGAQGIIDVQESFELVIELANPHLKLLGYLITMVNPRKSIHKMYEETLREQYGDLVFATRIPHAAEFPEAIAYRKPVALYKPKGAAAKAIQALAEEIEVRLGEGKHRIGEAAGHGKTRRTAARGRE